MRLHLQESRRPYVSTVNFGLKRRLRERNHQNSTNRALRIDRSLRCPDVQKKIKVQKLSMPTNNTRNTIYIMICPRLCVWCHSSQINEIDGAHIITPRAPPSSTTALKGTSISDMICRMPKPVNGPAFTPPLGLPWPAKCWSRLVEQTGICGRY